MDIDYTKMADGDLYKALGNDVTKWAAAFQQCIVDKNVPIDEDLMVTWFSNVIMADHDASGAS